MKIEIKWLDQKWKSFSPTRSHFSAGIREITELVEEELDEQKEPWQAIKWRVKGSTLVAELTDRPQEKLSKSRA